MKNSENETVEFTDPQSPIQTLGIGLFRGKHIFIE